MTDKLFATKGEHVTCPNGHVICTIARDLSEGDESGPADDFCDWQQKQPALGTPTNEIRCEICGKWWTTTYDSERLDFADGTSLVVRSGNAMCIEGKWRHGEFPPESEWPAEMRPD